MVSKNIFMVNIENLLCIVDYYNKFPVVKKVGSMSAEDLIQLTTFVFAEFGMPKKFVSDAGPNFISEQFKEFCRCSNIDQVVTLSCHHHSNGKVDACINFVKHTIKMKKD